MKIIPAAMRLLHDAGPFQIRRSYPGGARPRTADYGLGPFGCMDDAALAPGLVVPMHQHRDDEILSYLRAGELHHTDTRGEGLRLSPAQPLLMNAGRGLAHEERVPADGEPVAMLQIFVRPTASGLPPALQTTVLDPVRSENAWRLVAGPAGSGAPLTFRNAVWFHDTHLRASRLAVPAAPGVDYARWLYVFSGTAQIEGETLRAGDAVRFDDSRAAVIETSGEADLVCFVTHLTAPFVRTGTLSG
jgi:redox-sensitive bicupin YhaK (pirin superfamily)